MRVAILPLNAYRHTESRSYSLDGKTAENLDFAERSRIRLTVVLVVVTVPLAGIPACSCSPRHTSRPNDRFEELSER